MQSHYTYQDTNISLKTGTKNIRRSTPTRDQNSPLETQVENPNQDANLAAGFAILSTILNKLNLINMPSPTKDYIVRKATSLQNKGKRHSTTTTPATGNHRKNNFGKQSYQTGRCVGFTGAGSCVGAHTWKRFKL
jgi:hypothetical protein